MSTAAISPEGGRGKSLDANRYATKKTIAQGMLDIALLTANASQLKYILQVGEKHDFYALMITLITISIVLQVFMGVLFLSLNLLRDCRLHREEYRLSALIINYTTMGLSVVVTALNLLVLVGVVFLVIGGLDINEDGDQRAALILNDVSLVMVFVISLLNAWWAVMLSLCPFLQTLSKALQGILNVILGSSFNINKTTHQKTANIWNNVVLSLNILTTVVNVIISAFDMRSGNEITSNNSTKTD